MTIGNSGPLGISTLKNEFTASANKLSAYYRNGPIVPGSIPGTSSPGNSRPGNSRPGNPRPGSSNPCRANSFSTVPGTSTCTMKNINGGASFASHSYSSGGPTWSKQMSCGANKCTNNNFSDPCNGGNVFFSVPANVGGSQTKPAGVRNDFTPGGYTPAGTNPPTTNPPTTNPPVTNNPVSINQPVPTSGTIALSNFYGARRA